MDNTKASTSASQSQAAQPTIKTWQERFAAAHPRSEAQYWPDSLKCKYMDSEIDDLRAHIAGTSQATNAQADLLKRIIHERDALAQAIAGAAQKAGIASPDACLTGPHLIMMCNDMAECALAAPVAKEAPQPEGFALMPLHMTPAMRRVTDEEGWQWEDLLAAAESITEEQYNEIAAGPVASVAEGAETGVQANEKIFEIASPYFVWNAESWRKATQGTIGMPELLEYTKAVMRAPTTSTVSAPVQAELERMYAKHKEWAERSGHEPMGWEDFQASRLENPLSRRAIEFATDPDAAKYGEAKIVSSTEGAQAAPTNEDFVSVWELHGGHPADFAADVLERWGGWPAGVLGQGGSAQAAPEEVRNQALEEAAKEIEGTEDGIWANTCGRRIRALKRTTSTDQANADTESGGA